MSLLCLLLALAPAWAHKPSYADDHSTPDLAHTVEDPDISIVLYAELTCERETVWLTTETGPREEIWVELGVPVLDRLLDYRPSLALVAPGVGDDAVPFDIPEGYGAQVIDTSAVTEPMDFWEPFTQTASWILWQGWLAVPSDSQVYLVAWNPERVTGKVWVAVGKIEDFSDVELSDFVIWVEETSDFHEVGWAVPPEELDCALLEAEAEAEDEAGGKRRQGDEGGCATAPGGALGWTLLLPLVLLRRRR